MVKPKYAFRHPEFQEYLKFPEGWDQGEKRENLRKRRVFYDVKLYDWVIRHDLHADNMMIKTILERGVGYDRPFDFDEIVMDLKVYQIVDGQEVVYQELKDHPTLIHNSKYVCNVLKKIM